MSCGRIYCHQCKRVAMVCDGICQCGAFHEEERVQRESQEVKDDGHDLQQT
jgi:hypothetical protein